MSKIFSKIAKIYLKQANTHDIPSIKRDFLLKLSATCNFLANHWNKINMHQCVDNIGGIMDSKNIPINTKAKQYYEKNAALLKNQFKNFVEDRFAGDSQEKEVIEFIDMIITCYMSCEQSEPSILCPTEFLAYYFEAESRRNIFSKYAHGRGSTDIKEGIKYALSLRDLGIEYMYDEHWKLLENTDTQLKDKQRYLFDAQRDWNYDYIICTQIQEASKYSYDENVREYIKHLISQLKEHIKRNKTTLDQYDTQVQHCIKRSIKFCEPILAKFTQEDFITKSITSQINTFLIENKVSERDMNTIAFYVCRDLKNRGQLASVANLDINIIENQNEAFKKLMNKIQIIAKKETQATSLRKITISVEDLLSRIFYGIKYCTCKTNKERVNINKATQWVSSFFNASQTNALAHR